MAVPESQDTCTDFYRLVWPHRAMVLRSAMLLSHNIAEAEDITQETLFKASRALPALQNQNNIQPWLLTILRHTWTDRWRGRAGEGQVISLEALATEPAERAAWPEVPASDEIEHPDELLECVSDAQLIRAIRGLPEEMRWAILLVDIGGYDYETSAGVLDVPVGTIRSRLSRGRAILRSLLLTDQFPRGGRHLKRPTV
ncbi:MAG: RNA polymerase sigma factor [Phycisphaerae bacterium]|nr:RNA polymerase sigma factor [Phycisphaerae bacterium]